MARVEVDNFQEDLLLSFIHIRSITNVVLRNLRISAGSVSFYFTDLESICDLHLQFFNDSSPTDCISFPAHDFEKGPFRCDFLGEIFICPHVALEYSRKRGTDPYDEIILYIVHGLLHLAGFEDTSPSGALAMEELQEKLCALLSIKGLTLNPAKSSLVSLKDLDKKDKHSGISK